MTELIKMHENEEGKVLVSGRELHGFLQIKTAYTRWFDRMREYGFGESIDFTVIAKNVKDDSAFGGKRKLIDHAITLDMAKEISMIQRTDKGKQARQYFLQVEKKWNSPEMIVQRALQIQTKKVEQLKLENAELKPKALFADSVSASHTSILVGELAKLLKQNGLDMGQNKLFTWLRDHGYLIRRKGTDYNMPTQKAMEMKLFEIKETSINRSNGTVSISKTPKVTGKGQVYFVNKFCQKTA
ncbi:phage antirepressor KilAC domain-containing protein [Melissococcus plutonius]|uniref:phage antirepressor KilAC domain-containing protein n=4 Tax=Melissococcus plutonius TaxID=33970 RepID=UPI00065E7122|nr:phage antirepressor KilAC domain-containing protein [Melissococcus plutonius]KMT32940.1 phage antirepressor protein [Melissococcus plutonius]